jgi:hypothetical protein
MLFITRLVTAAGSFALLFFALWIGGLVLGSGIAGGIAGSENPQNAEQVGRDAGEKFT